MRRVMIFLPPKSSPTPTPTPSPLPPIPPFAPPAAFMERTITESGLLKNDLQQDKLQFTFYVVEGANNQPEIVCLETSPEIKCLAGPYDSYDVAKKIQENLTSVPPTP